MVWDLLATTPDEVHSHLEELATRLERTVVVHDVGAFQNTVYNQSKRDDGEPLDAASGEAIRGGGGCSPYAPPPGRSRSGG